MQLEFRHGDTVVRLDGDVVEIFWAARASHRFLLSFLTVQVQPGPIKGQLVVRTVPGRPGSPLYELKTTYKHVGGTTETVIPAEAEPLYRQFFTHLAQLCGRPVVI